MSDVLLLPTNNYASLVTPTASVSFDAEHPLTGLNDMNPARIAKSTSTAAQDIDTDFGSGQSHRIDAVVIINTNLPSSLAGVLFNGADNPANLTAGSADFSVTVPIPVRDVDGHVRGTWVDIRPIVPTEATRTVRAVRLRLPATTTAPWLGEVLFGQLTPLPGYFEHPTDWREVLPSTVHHKTSHFSDLIYERSIKLWDIVAPMTMTRAQAQDVRAMWTAVRGVVRPLVVTMDNIPYLVRWTNLFEPKQLDYNTYRVNFHFTQVSTGPSLVAPT